MCPWRMLDEPAGLHKDRHGTGLGGGGRGGLSSNGNALSWSVGGDSPGAGPSEARKAVVRSESLGGSRGSQTGAGKRAQSVRIWVPKMVVSAVSAPLWLAAPRRINPGGWWWSGRAL